MTFRLSDEAISVIGAHQGELSVVNRREVDRTEALEDIILKFPKKLNLGNLFRRKKHAPDPQTPSLEVFTSA